MLIENNEIISLFEKNDKDKVSFTGLLKTFDRKEAANGNTYVICSFGDKGYSINCKIWDESIMKIVETKGVFNIDGEINDWKGQRSVNITKAQATSEPSENYMETVPNSEELAERVLKALDKLDHSTIYYKITNHILANRIERFKKHPAAMFMHHDLIGGLVLHTSNMLILGYRIKETYKDIYGIINWDLLASGIILHDMAKLNEISIDKGLVDYSTEGNLLGHITMGICLISRACLELDIDENLEEVIMLKHMLLSHHGRSEWGSPKEPAFPEAMLLHQLDVIDSSMDRLNNKFKEMGKGDCKKGVYRPK